MELHLLSLPSCHLLLTFTTSVSPRDTGCLSVLHVCWRVVAHSKRRSADNYWSAFQPRASFLLSCLQPYARGHARPATQNTPGPHQSYRRPWREAKTLTRRKKSANRHASGEAAAWDWVAAGERERKREKGEAFRNEDSGKASDAKTTSICAAASSASERPRCAPTVSAQHKSLKTVCLRFAIC